MIIPKNYMILYTIKDDTHCNDCKAFLDEHKIPYKEYRLDTQEVYTDIVKADYSPCVLTKSQRLTFKEFLNTKKLVKKFAKNIDHLDTHPLGL